MKEYYENNKHPWEGREHTSETKEKMRKNAFNNPNHYKHFKEGMKLPEWWKEKLRKPHKMSKEGSQAIRDSVMNRPHFIKIPYTRKDGKVVSLDSSYEVKFATACDKWDYEWERNTKESVIYIDDEDKERHYYPDFFVWMNGDRFVVETKGEHLMDDHFMICGVKSYAMRKRDCAIEKYGSKYMLFNLDEIEQFEDEGVMSYGC